MSHEDFMAQLMAKAASLKSSTTKTEAPLSYREATEQYNPSNGDLRAASALFFRLCNQVLENMEKGSKINELVSHPAPDSLKSLKIDGGHSYTAIRIFSESYGSMVLAKYYPKEQKLIPYAIEECRIRQPVFWFHTETDSYRYEASDRGAAQKLFEEQVPSDKRRNVSIDVEEVTKTNHDAGSPYSIAIENNGEVKSLPGLSTVASALKIGYEECCKCGGGKMIVRNKNKKTVFSRDFQPLQTTQEATSQQLDQTQMPSSLVNAINQASSKGQSVIVLKGDASSVMHMLGISEQALTKNQPILVETPNGDKYYLVEEVGCGYAIVKDGKGILSENLKASSTIIEYKTTVLNESTCDSDVGIIVQQLIDRGFRGPCKSIKESLVKHGLVYSEKLGLGIVTNNNNPQMWENNVYHVVIADPNKLRKKLEQMPEAFYMQKETYTPIAYMKTYNHYSGLRDLILWEGLNLSMLPGPFNLRDVVQHVDNIIDASKPKDTTMDADLHAKILVRRFGMDEAKSRTQKKLDQYIRDFPGDAMHHAYYKSVLGKIGSQKSETSEEVLPKSNR